MKNQEVLAQFKLNSVWMVCVWSWLQAAVLGSSWEDAAWMVLEGGGVTLRVLYLSAGPSCGAVTTCAVTASCPSPEAGKGAAPLPPSCRK